MITEAILSVFGGLLSFLVGLLPDVAPPSWYAQASDFLANGLASAQAFAWFMPVVAIGQCFVFLGLCLVIVWSVRLFRIGLSLITGGGGSAA